MSTPLKCLDCIHYEYCEHTSMGFCNEVGQPAWMAYKDLYDSDLARCSKMEAPFPYSKDNPVLKSCKNSGEGNIWCYPGNREKYSEVCKDCSMNPDIETGLSIYNQEKR